MTTDDKLEPQILEGDDALVLWRKGWAKWNEWIAENPGCSISFAGHDFSKEEKPPEFGGYEFGDGRVDFSRVNFGNRDVSFVRSTFGKGDVNFSKAKFGDRDTNFKETVFGEGNINFSDAIFGKGAVKFSKVDFGSGNVDFSKATFGNRGVYFSKAKFGDGGVDFSEADFGKGSVDFFHTNFGSGTINFHRAVFNGTSANFSHATFGKGRVNFSHATFGKGVVDFSMTTFDDTYLNFFFTTFGDGVVNFFESNFGNGGVNFLDSNFGETEINFDWAKLENFMFQPKVIGSGVFSAEGLSVGRTAELVLPPSASSLKSFNLYSASFDGPLTLKANLKIVPDLRGTKSSHQVELSRLNIKLCRIPMARNWFKKFSAVAEDHEDAARLRRLKEIAESNKDHQAALRFSADENRARRWIETSWLGSVLDMAFSACSNYGQSILRPFVALFLLAAASMGIYKELATSTFTAWWKAWEHATLLSISNSLPFLPQSRGLREDALKALYPGDPGFWVDALIIGQGVFSFAFLFLIGLGLRNRFRL